MSLRASVAGATSMLRPSRVHVDYSALAGNYLALQAQAPTGCVVVPTIKADAYGHGAVMTMRACWEVGARYFAVASLAEALELRHAGLTCPVLVMSYIPAAAINIAASHNITATVYDEGLADMYKAELLPCNKLTVHVKIDSGMGRLGVPLTRAQGLVRQLRAGSCFDVEGILTHYSRADDDAEWTARQTAAFVEVLKVIEAAEGPFRYRHGMNSAGLLFPAAAAAQSVYQGNMARTGIALYGCVPGPLSVMPSALKPAMTWVSEVAQVKTLPPGHSIGYGNTYVTSASETVALVPVGYSDGFRRGPTNAGEVLIHGVRCPIRGRVSMEKTVVSVQHLPRPVAIGDEVVLLGRQGDEVITAEDVGGRIGTINYEVLTSALARVRRQWSPLL